MRRRVYLKKSAEDINNVQAASILPAYYSEDRVSAIAGIDDDGYLYYTSNSHHYDLLKDDPENSKTLMSLYFKEGGKTTPEHYFAPGARFSMKADPHSTLDMIGYVAKRRIYESGTEEIDYDVYLCDKMQKKITDSYRCTARIELDNGTEKFTAGSKMV